ncbi:uncharacterized protein LOC116618107 [Nematostella vectensis]|uniref:uncharacterized protein LOC116618107 n=1 Tax=Nematostella vectensis TaxID=45351 RepID=UPI0020772084|nr:uncharacterized protein LOC116618107 [Nematostella vectensis]
MAEQTTRSFLLFLVLFINCYNAEIYQSVQWTPNNPLFEKGTCCDNRVPEIRVLQQSALPIICPNLNIVMKTLPGLPDKSTLYTNIWIIFDDQSFETCNVNKSIIFKTHWKNDILKRCDTPLELKEYTLKFRTSSAIIENIEFDKEKYYGIMATTDGTKDSINNTVGGSHCTGSDGVRLKFKFYLCGDNDIKCKSDVGELKCPDKFENATKCSSDSTTTAPPPAPTSSSATSGNTSTTISDTTATPTSSRTTQIPGQTQGRVALPEFDAWKMSAIFFVCMWVLTMVILIYTCYRYKTGRHRCCSDLNKVTNSDLTINTNQSTLPREPMNEGYDNPTFSDYPDGSPSPKDVSPESGVSLDGSNGPALNGSPGGRLQGVKSEGAVVISNKAANGSLRHNKPALPNIMTDDEKIKNLRNSEKSGKKKKGPQKKSDDLIMGKIAVDNIGQDKITPDRLV